MDALAFLDKSARAKRQPVYVLAGDEDFLKRRCRDAVIALVLKDADPDFAVANYAGDKVDFSTIRNDLDTLPFLSPARVVIVDQADTFVTEHRPQLEKYAQAPSKIGVLVLDVKTFPETTKLAKALPDGAKIACKAPPTYKIADWCASWAQVGHGKRLAGDAAALLVDLVGPQMGLLDQELEKLAVAVGPKPQIEAADVDTFVGRSRAANVFRIVDAIGEGKPAEALGVLSDLFEEGEDPLAVLGPLTAQLRKLATIGRLLGRGESLGPAMDAAKVPTWPQARQSCERQIRHLGRRRLEQIPEWLVEINLGLKGGNPLPPRLQLERLIVRLARPREAEPARGG
ncbi:DNA polymerase III subunit delta [Fimbriiglobus ruber]|uniref:DNA polymerase III subunit delta n=1 Tax=Fimbriiglobus ruber TaxID=1908690 RepID=A0A225E958_9BACT|nr:DNA polymerase III subunit delta [Fimbriiglobus ruber]OWK44957.1 DNA polymerase III delta subunit [Fimbriiglobus ruber]